MATEKDYAKYMSDYCKAEKQAALDEQLKEEILAGQCEHYSLEEAVEDEIEHFASLVVQTSKAKSLDEFLVIAVKVRQNLEQAAENYISRRNRHKENAA